MHALNQFLKYHVKILLGDFTVKVGKEDIFVTVIPVTLLISSINLFTHSSIFIFSIILFVLL
jgi:hypothetical protein